MLECKYIIRSPRVRFTLIKPRGIIKYKGIIDTRVKVNIIPKEISKSIRGVAYNIKRYRMFITTSIKFGFVSIVELRIEVVKGVGCNNAFFLVKGASKSLLK